MKPNHLEDLKLENIGNIVYNPSYDKLIEDTIKNTKIDNLKLVSSNVDLSGLEVETASENRRAFLLKDKLKIDDLTCKIDIDFNKVWL